MEYNISHIATSGTIYFSKEKISNWREFVKYNNFGRWYAWVMAMLRRGIIPQALGYDEQWTVSVQHTKEDIEKTLEVMKEAVGEIKGEFRQLAVEEIL